MSTEDKRLKNLRPPWKKGESGNPRGGNHLQTLRAQLAKLDPVAMNAMRRVLKMEDVDDKTWRFVFRCYLKLRYPEEWREAEIAALQAAQPPQGQPSQPFLTRPELSQEDRRAVIDFLAQHLRPKQVPNGAAENGHDGAIRQLE